MDQFMRTRKVGSSLIKSDDSVGQAQWHMGGGLHRMWRKIFMEYRIAEFYVYITKEFQGIN